MADAVSKSQFAEILGVSRAYVSQLVGAKRLVLTDDGRQVMVDASLELLGATSDPSKEGVRERWAAMREGAGKPAAVPAVDLLPTAVQVDASQAAAEPQRTLIDEPAAASAAATPAAAPGARSDYQDARTRREQAEAEMAQIELMERRGKVLDADSTVRAIADVHTAARVEVLSLPDRLAQLVAAEVDPRKVWQLINAECELLCQRLEANIRRLAVANVEVSA